MTGLIVPPGQGRKLITKAQEVTFKATGAQGSTLSIFEVVVPPGFDVGAHVHHDAQEFFYVLEGELELLAFEPERRTEDSWHQWTSPQGDQIAQATEGAFMFVPPGTPHAFRNASSAPARMLFQCYPSPYHEFYFEEIAEIWAAGGQVDQQAVERMRRRYDVHQLTPLRFDPPDPTPGPGPVPASAPVSSRRAAKRGA
ncbi:cupin domain-containing protein [Streptomyces sp. NPDC010273]|uniref:cupin domain-containing protein n=1 Tax=Streptomyces sp. NPDC010273 TaxID=3364829 RepID=UPI0036F09274